MPDGIRDDANHEMNDSVAAVDQKIEWVRARLWQGHYDEEVEQALHDVHDRATSLQHLPLQTRSLRLLGSLAYLVMNLDLAREYINQALTLALRLKDTGEMLTLGAHLGFVYRAQGEPQMAVQHLQHFVDKLDLVEITPQLVRPAISVLLRYTICLLLIHEYAPAAERLHQAEMLLERYDSGQHPEEAAALISYLTYAWAAIYLHQEDFNMAWQYSVAHDFAIRQLGRQADVVLVNLVYLRLDLFSDQSAEDKEIAWTNMLVTVQPFLISEKLHPAVQHHIAQYGFLEEADYYAFHGHLEWARRLAEEALQIFERIQHQPMIDKALAFLETLEVQTNGAEDH